MKIILTERQKMIQKVMNKMYYESQNKKNKEVYDDDEEEEGVW